MIYIQSNENIWFWPRPHETLCCNRQRKVTRSFSENIWLGYTLTQVRETRGLDWVRIWSAVDNAASSCTAGNTLWKGTYKLSGFWTVPPHFQFATENQEDQLKNTQYTFPSFQKDLQKRRHHKKVIMAQRGRTGTMVPSEEKEDDPDLSGLDQVETIWGK